MRANKSISQRVPQKLRVTVKTTWSLLKKKKANRKQNIPKKIN